MMLIRIVVLTGLMLPATAYAIPEYMNYQARIFDATGQPMQGIYAMAFAIFDATGTDASATETLLWGPFVCDGLVGQGHAARVTVWDGWFNVILGPVDVASRPMTSAFAAGDELPRFIEITVEGETIAPRQQFLTAPYAAHAKQADTAIHGVPAGSILAYFGMTAPPGWLMCDGGLVPEGAAFDALRSLVGLNTPDLRGRFILMADPAGEVLSATVDLAAAGGEERHQLIPAEMPSHNHSFTVNDNGWPDGGNDTGGDYQYWNTLWASNATIQTSQAGGNAPHNNMPPFFALNWIIKY